MAAPRRRWMQAAELVWGARIRTWIVGFKGRCPAVRRLPNNRRRILNDRRPFRNVCKAFGRPIPAGANLDHTSVLVTFDELTIEHPFTGRSPCGKQAFHE